MEFPELEGTYQEMLKVMTAEEAAAHIKLCALCHAEGLQIIAKKRKKSYQVVITVLPVCYLTGPGGRREEECKFCSHGKRLAIQKMFQNTVLFCWL